MTQLGPAVVEPFDALRLDSRNVSGAARAIRRLLRRRVYSRATYEQKRSFSPCAR